ncbi:MAG: 30S ribosomal protein S5 [archaeon]|jgi:small subunit ribosomal protein S5
MNRKDVGRGKKPGRRDRVEESEIERIERELSEKQLVLDNWVPKTELGRDVKSGKITNVDDIYEKGLKVLEPEIPDSLLRLEDHLVQVARTTRVTRAGRKYSYRADVLVGNRAGYIGIGSAKDVDRFPAINKAKRMAKLNLMRIYPGSGSWEEQSTSDKHSVPFKVTGKSGSVRVILMPAPKGTGLAVGKGIKPVMELAGIKNVWGRTQGRSCIQLNFVQAAIDALAQTAKMKASRDIERKLSKDTRTM